MTNWAVDKSHSTVGFEVKHMMISKVKGQFLDYSAEVNATDLKDLTSAHVQFTFDVASITTNSDDRDNHLRSADFFNVEQYPSITFSSTTIEQVGADYKITGDLTIRDTTKPIIFDVAFGGHGKNPWGVEVYGFEGSASINREEFGLTWNQTLETGGVLVGKEIKIKVELEINPS